jgi:tetratricopeptide (TPR) repeat protein
LRRWVRLARAFTSCHDEAVTTASADTALARGYGALAVGNWSEARAAFEESVSTAESAEALDGLGRSLWWLREAREAVVCRERAYSGFRRDGELGRAARIALWLSREYALVFGNDAAARGWLARAQRLLTDVAPGAEQGWIDLARSEGSRDPSEAAIYAEAALDSALAAGDPDLELRALAQLGLVRVSAGDVDEGLAQLDEAMAAATSGEPATLETFADICCTLLLACERAGDVERPKQWSSVLEDFVRNTITWFSSRSAGRAARMFSLPTDA